LKNSNSQSKSALEIQKAKLLEVLAKACKTPDNDEAIVNAWHPFLKDYEKARVFLPMVERSRLRLQALLKFREALNTGEAENIVETFNWLVRDNPKITKQERSKFEQARKLIEGRARLWDSFEINNDSLIVSAFLPALETSNLLSNDDLKRYELAKQRVEEYDRFRLALETDNDEVIIRDYNPILDNSLLVKPQDAQRLILARKRIEIIQQLHSIFTSADPYNNSNPYKIPLELVQKIIQEGLIDLLLKKYSSLSEDSKNLILREIDSYKSQGVEKIRQALWMEDDVQITEIYSKYEVMFRQIGCLEKFEVARINKAIKRNEALVQVQWAINFGSGDQVETAWQTYGPCVMQSRNFTRNERQTFNESRQKNLLNKLRQAFSSQNIKEIVEVGEKAIEAGSALIESDYKRLIKAKESLTALNTFENALTQNDDLKIIGSYNAELLDKLKSITQPQRYRLKIAQKRVEIWYKLKAALADSDEKTLADLYDPDLFKDCFLLNDLEREQCELALQRKQNWVEVEKAFKKKNFEFLLQKNTMNQFEGTDYLNSELINLLNVASKQKELENELFIAQAENDPRKIEQAAINLLEVGLPLSDDFKWDLVLEEAYNSKNLEELKALLRSPTPDNFQLIFLGRSFLTGSPEKITKVEKNLILKAVDEFGAKERLKRALKKGDLELIARIYQPDSMEKLPFTQNERHLIEMARTQ